MLSPDRLITDLTQHYPEEFRLRLQTEIVILLQRQRHYLLGQLQLLFSRHSDRIAIEDFRNELDELFLSPDHATPIPPETPPTE